MLINPDMVQVREAGDFEKILGEVYMGVMLFLFSSSALSGAFGNTNIAPFWQMFSTQ